MRTKTYTQTTLTPIRHINKLRHSDKPNDKRHKPADQKSKGKHLGNQEDWTQASIKFFEEQDYYMAQFHQKKYINDPIIYQLASAKAYGDYRKKGFKLRLIECKTS